MPNLNRKEMSIEMVLIEVHSLCVYMLDARDLIAFHTWTLYIILWLLNNTNKTLRFFRDPKIKIDTRSKKMK